MLRTVVLSSLVCLATSSRLPTLESEPFFATKTSYFPNSNPDTSSPVPEGCRPKLFWHLARHGARYPSDDEILDMNTNLYNYRAMILEAASNGEGSMFQDDLDNLAQWTFNLTEQDHKQLTKSGRREHLEMGERWKVRLSESFSFNSQNTEVRSSVKPRSWDSGKAFLDGFLGGQMPMVVDNHLCRYFEECNYYQDTVYNNPETYAEVEKFVASAEFLGMEADVELLTGVPFTVTDLEIIWKICRFEAAWYPDQPLDPWCSLFTEEQFHMFEYKEDMEYYYTVGPKYNITLAMTQPLWNDLFTRMTEVSETGATHNSSVLLFSHSDGLQPFMGSLGLYQNGHDPVAADWPAEDRLWKTSRIGPFATNIDVMLLQCSQEESAEEDLKVMLFHKERHIEVPDLGLLPTLGEFLEKYQHFATTDYYSMCKIYP